MLYVISVLLLLLLFIFATLFLPFHVRFNGAYERVFSGIVSLSWIGRFLCVRHVIDKRITIVLLGERRLMGFSTAKAGKHKRKTAKKSRRRRRMPVTRLPAMLHVMQRIFRSLSPHGNARIIFGCPTPALTGIVFGAASSLFALLPLSIKIIPDFVKPGLAVDGTIEFRIVIADLLAIILSKEGRTLIRSINGGYHATGKRTV